MKNVLAFLGPALGAIVPLLAVSDPGNRDWALIIASGLLAGFGGNAMKEANGYLDRRKKSDG